MVDKIYEFCGFSKNGHGLSLRLDNKTLNSCIINCLQKFLNSNRSITDGLFQDFIAECVNNNFILCCLIIERPIDYSFQSLLHNERLRIFTQGIYYSESGRSYICLVFSITTIQMFMRIYLYLFLNKENKKYVMLHNTIKVESYIS